MLFKFMILISIFLFMFGISEFHRFDKHSYNGKFFPLFFAVGLWLFMFGMFGVFIPPRN